MGTTANAADNSLTAIIDASISNVQGSLLYRGASSWSALAPGTSGQLLQTGGSAANPSWTTQQERLPIMQVIVSSGTFTVPAGVDKIKVTVVGGGGNGASAGGGGGGGGTCIIYATGLTAGGTVAVTVGAAGGTSSFGTYCTATGGISSAGINGGAGGIGTGSGTAINFTGSGGGGGGTGSGFSVYGVGGSSSLGGGGYGNINAAGGAGGNYGGGGGGGAAGSQGIVILEY